MTHQTEVPQSCVSVKESVPENRRQNWNRKVKRLLFVAVGKRVYAALLKCPKSDLTW